MTAFRLSAKSLEDLKVIGRFTRKSWKPEQCKIYLSKLDESFHILADQPHLGITRNDIRRNISPQDRWVRRDYLIFSRRSPTGAQTSCSTGRRLRSPR